MLTRFNRMLQPFNGLHNGGGGGGGGGGGTVSDAEFDAAIAQDTANKLSGGGGISYGSGSNAGYSSTPTQAQLDAQAAVDLAAAQAKAAEDAKYQEYLAQEAARTAELQRQQSLFDEAGSLFGVPEKATVVQEGSIADVGFFDWLTNTIINDPDSDIAKTTGYDFADIAVGTGYAINPTTNELEIKVSGGAENDLATLLDYSGLNQFFDVEDLAPAWNDAVSEKYGANSKGFADFTKDFETVQELGTSWFGFLGDQPDVIARDDGQLYAKNPVSVAGIVGDVVDLFGGKLVGSLGAQITGDVVYGMTGQALPAAQGAMATKQILDYVAPIDHEAYIGLDGRTHIEQSIFGQNRFVAVDDLFKNSIEATEAVNQQLASSPLKFNSETSSYTSSGFDFQTSLATGIGNSTAETTIGVPQQGGKKQGWESFYDPWENFTAKDILGEVAASGISGATAVLGEKAPELYKAAQLAVRVNGGESLPEAALSVYGTDFITKATPEGWQAPTEAALRIAAGENRVAVLGDLYGEQFNLDNPLGKAGLKIATIYDQTGDEGQALQNGIVTYFKEGGTLPEFDLPEFIQGSSADINLNLPDLGFIEDGLKDGLSAAGDMINGFLDKIPDVNVNFEGIPNLFEGVRLPDIGNLDGLVGFVDNLKERIPDIDIEVPDLIPQMDFEGVTLADIGGDWSLPELKGLGINLPDLDLSLPLTAALVSEERGLTPSQEEEAKQQMAETTVENPLDNELLLSRQVLERTFV